MELDESILFLLICQWTYESGKLHSHPEHYLTTDNFIGWLEQNHKSNTVRLIRNSRSHFEKFINTHKAFLADYCKNIFHHDNDLTTMLPDIQRDLKNILQLLLLNSPKRPILTEFANEILLAFEIFHEIALYRVEGFVRVGLTTEDEHDLKGLEYIHAFDELRDLGYIKHNLGRHWYITDHGLKILKEIKAEKAE